MTLIGGSLHGYPVAAPTKPTETVNDKLVNDIMGTTLGQTAISANTGKGMLLARWPLRLSAAMPERPFGLILWVSWSLCLRVLCAAVAVVP